MSITSIINTLAGYKYTTKYPLHTGKSRMKRYMLHVATLDNSMTC